MNKKDLIKRVKALQKEEAKIYNAMCKILSKLDEKEQKLFFEIQNEWLENQLEIESYCGR